MSDIIATESYAKSIGGKDISYISDLGCTKSRAMALGCEVSGIYTDNQLVCQKDLSKIKYSLTCHITYTQELSQIPNAFARFFIVSDGEGLLNTRNYMNFSSTRVSCTYISTAVSYNDELFFSGNKYTNINGTFNMISGNTYYILYVLIGPLSDGSKIPPGPIINNSTWTSIGSFIFNSSTYEQSINLTL